MTGRLAVALAIVGLAVSFYPAYRFGSEFMPPLNEGDLLYMPTTASSIVTFLHLSTTRINGR